MTKFVRLKQWGGTKAIPISGVMAGGNPSTGPAWPIYYKQATQEQFYVSSMGSLAPVPATIVQGALRAGTIREMPLDYAANGRVVRGEVLLDSMMYVALVEHRIWNGVYAAPNDVCFWTVEKLFNDGFRNTEAMPFSVEKAAMKHFDGLLKDDESRVEYIPQPGTFDPDILKRSQERIAEAAERERVRIAKAQAERLKNADVSALSNDDFAKLFVGALSKK